MHFLGALELIAASALGIIEPLVIASKEENEEATEDEASIRTSSSRGRGLPPPSTTNITTLNSKVSSVLYGVSKQSTTTNANDHNHEEWEINPISCGTTFEPILNGNLQSLVVSSTTVVQETEDIMFPKGSMFYNRGWVIDLGGAERKAKQKLLRYGGLGYIDSKKSFNGVYASGVLHFFLPYDYERAHEHAPNNSNNFEQHVVGDTGHQMHSSKDAQDYFRSVIVCETNQNRSFKACNLEQDVSYTIGGVSLSEVHYIQAEGVSYLGNNICVYIDIPKLAEITTDSRSNADDNKNNVDVSVGIDLQISVTNKRVTVKDGACSISHVVWENVPCRDLHLHLH